MMKVFLKKQEERRVKAGHLWVYSNEIDTAKSPLNAFKPGQLGMLTSAQGETLGTGYLNPNTLLAFRLLSRSAHENIDADFFITRFNQALSLRERLFQRPFYRLVYGESDGLPGLVIDRFNDIFVVQITTAGMESLRDLVIEALQKRFSPKTIVLKNDASARAIEGLPEQFLVVQGELPELIQVEENHLQFQVSLTHGQKTGWFYDQRLNRAAIIPFVTDKRVLDVYSYAGGFGIVAASNGALDVVCIDSSPHAVTNIERNAKLNQVSEKVKTITADAFEALKELRAQGQRFDVVIVDPPAFIKKRKDIKEGAIAYQRLNELAMQVLSEDGILVSASCSMHMQQEMLIDVIRRASLKQQRFTQLIALGTQGPDHPIHPAIPETQYLKTIICRIRDI